MALSATRMVAESAPAAVGLKATVKVQLAPAVKVEPQPFAGMRNDEALVPLDAMEEMLTVVVPVFVRVAV